MSSRWSSDLVADSLAIDYQQQRQWRDWETALRHCPIQPGHSVLDLGSGPGELSRELAQRGACVTGVDGNESLLEIARQTLPDGKFLSQDLRALSLPTGSFDGLWCSFTAAYFPRLEEVLPHWLRRLRPGGWFCFVEMDDLLGHEPLSIATQRKIAAFYEHTSRHGRYDFLMGRRLGPALAAVGAVNSFTLADQELSSQGPVPESVLNAWERRLARMQFLQSWLGVEYLAFREEFLGALNAPEHVSRCRVLGVAGTVP